MKLLTIKQVLKDAWRAIKLGYLSSRRDHYGYIHDTAEVFQPTCGAKQNVYLYENTQISEYSKFITSSGKFILKKYSSTGMGLTVIAQNHDFFSVGSYPGDRNWASGEKAADVIVEDYVWIGTNVTLCPGVHISRGCLVAAGSVCVKSKEYPPYTIIGGNPAKVIKYRFTYEEQLRQEELVVPKEERLTPQYLKETYDRVSAQLKNKYRI